MIHIPTTVKNKDLVAKRRKQIVFAAIKLFSRKGFHKTTLKELAEEAGLSYGNIYDYVGSKEDIFFLIHDIIAGSAMEILRRSLEEVHDPLEKLQRMVKGEFDLMDQWADGVMLLYQEIHILNGEFLWKLLQKERDHLEIFEIILKECIDKGILKPCNVRLVANLIKSMIDAWTIKRWDLRGHTTQVEAEQTIMELIFHGLLKAGPQGEAFFPKENTLSGKKALVVNGGTIMGQAVCQALTAKGIRVIVHVDDRRKILKPSRNSGTEDHCKPVHYLEQAEAPTAEQINDIEKEFGPIDFYLHDLGIGTTENQSGTGSENHKKSDLEANLRSAHELAYHLKEKMGGRTMGRIVYLAPWAWDSHADPIGFDIVKAGTIALTRSLSGQLAPSNVNVNCIVPGYIRGIRPLKIEKSMGQCLLQRIPSGRLGEVFDVTETVLFLLQDGSKYLTGQVLNVSGGH